MRIWEEITQVYLTGFPKPVLIVFFFSKGVLKRQNLEKPTKMVTDLHNLP